MTNQGNGRGGPAPTTTEPVESAGKHDRFDRRCRVRGAAEDALKAVLADNSGRLF